MGTRVNSASISANSAGATAYTVALGVAVNVGDVIVVAGAGQGTHAANGMSATMTATSQAFTTIGEVQGGNASSRWLQTFVYVATQAFLSSDTITFTPYAASTQNSFSVDIFRGYTSTIDRAATGQSNASGTTTAPALGGAAAVGALVLTFVQTAAGTLTAGSPFSTGSAAATNESTAVGYVLAGDGVSTYASTWTFGTAGTNSTQTVSFLPAAAAGGATYPVLRAPSALVLGRNVAYQMAANITTPPTAPAPAFVTSFIGGRRPAIARQRRGQFWQVPPTPAGSTPCTPPAFGSIGTLHGATTSTPAFVAPSGVAAGDIIVVAFFADVSTTTITGFPAGFQHAENSPRTVNAGGTANHVLNVCWKRATGADTGTYTFTLSAAVFVYGNAVRYTGCQTTGNPWDSPTSAADGGAASTNTTPAVSVNTAGGNRLLFFAGSNWNGDGGTWSAPTLFNQRQGGVNTSDIEISDLVQVTQGSSGTVQASDTLAGHSGAWLGALIGTCPTVSAPPALVSPTRRPNGLVRAARGRLWAVPPTVVVAPPTAAPPPTFVAYSRRPSVRVARGKFWSSLPPIVVPPVPFGSRVRAGRAARISHGQFFATPGTTTNQAAAAPRTTGRTVRPVMTRRGEFFSVPTTRVAVVPPRVRLAIHWPGVVRRGQIFPAPTPAVVVAGQTGPLVSKTTRLAIHWPGPIRHGKFFPSMASSHAAPAVVVFPPRVARLTIHWPGPVRRGKFFPSMASSQAAPPTTPTGPVWMIRPHQPTRILNRRGQILPVVGGHPTWVPPPTAPTSRVGARTTRPGMTGRSRIWITPTTPTGPIPRPPIGSTRRIMAVRPPRGRFFPCMPSAQAAPPPPRYVARIMRAAPRSWFFARQGHLQFTRLTGAFGFPAEFASSSSGLDMISAGSAVDLHTADTGSAEFMGSDQGVTFADGSSGTEMRLGP